MTPPTEPRTPQTEALAMTPEQVRAEVAKEVVPNADIHTLDLPTLFYVRESIVGARVVKQGWYHGAVELIDEIIRLREGPRPEPRELWEQAGGDRDRYIDLMVQHGHLIRGRRHPGTDIFGHPVAASEKEPTE